MKAVKKAIFPVGGVGTRFLPITKSMPKEMLPILDRPLIHYAVEEAKKAGIEIFIFVSARGKTAIIDYFDAHAELDVFLEQHDKHDALTSLRSGMLDPGQIISLRQQAPLGLGHAVWCARHLIERDEAVAILLADDLIDAQKPCLQQMIETYYDYGSNILATMEVPKEKVSSYGIINSTKRDHNQPILVDVKGLIEKPSIENSPSNHAIIGRYILNASIFDYLAKFKRGAGGEIQLTDAMAQLLKKEPFKALFFEGARYDCGTVEGYFDATLAYALKRNDFDASSIIAKYRDNDHKIQDKIALAG